MSQRSGDLEQAGGGQGGRIPSASLSSPALVSIGLAVIGVYIAGMFVAMAHTPYDLWGAMFVGPVLVALTLPALSRQAAREGDRGLFWMLLAGLLLKLIMAALAYYVAFHVYNRVADSVGYHLHGAQIAARFRAGDFHTGLRNLYGLNFPPFLNGILYYFIGATGLGGFLFYAWLAFWGLLFSYRAFTIAVPEGRARSYGRLLFFLPSQLFWSSLMGKDPWMVFGLGIALLGVAHFLTGRIWRGLAFLALGAWFMSLVRPHVAAMVGLGLAAAFLVRTMPKQFRQLSLVVKAAGFALLMVGAVFLTHYTQRYLMTRGIDTGSGFTQSLEKASRGGAFGGSVFVPAIVRTPLDYPRAAITVLFRPFIFESHSFLEALVAIEGGFLALFTLIRIPWIVAALKSIRRQPYVLFSLVYAALFIYAFSAFANFGLLVRERVQLTPLFLVLLCVPPRKKEELPSPAQSGSLMSQRST